jgi:uncharacterized cupredoxin-like copper-binding protein
MLKIKKNNSLLLGFSPFSVKKIELKLNNFFLLKYLLIILIFCVINILPAQAANDYNEAKISLGNAQGELIFVPNNIEFETGKKYKLILDNPSQIKHYFTAKDFADAIWTQKVEAGNVEIKGAIHELELKPGAEAEWFFTPEKAGIYDLYCSIKGHKEAGMTGKIIIK